MRRISLSVLAGVALLGATVGLWPGTSAGVSQPARRTSFRLVAAAPNALTPIAPPRLAAGKSDLQHTLAQLLASGSTFGNPAARTRARPRRALGSSPIHARSLIRPLSLGMACPVATGSSPGGCSIVPCAVYVGAGQTNYTVTSGPSLGLAILPSVIARPSPGGRTPAGTCVSRPGRPPQMRWVSSTGH